MSGKPDYRWHLRTVMAGRGMFATTDLIPLLAGRGITLSSSQVYRLVVERPERLSLKILMALLDILDCTMDDLIEPVAAPGATQRPRKAAAAERRTPRGSARCARSGRGSPGRRRDRSARPAGSRRSGRRATRPDGEAGAALSPEAILGALDQAAARRDGRRRLAAAVTGQPELLTGQGARAPIPGVLRFISALARAGATAVAEPPCPRCGRQRQLGVPVEGLRLCAGCRSKARALPCGRCGTVRPPARLNDGGQSICQNCWHRDPRSWKPCAMCGNSRRVAALTPAGPVCQSCRPGPAMACSICGRPAAAGSASRGRPVRRCASGAANAGSPARAAEPGRR
jgi:DNA-binding Xre family transcriptional regulator